MECSERNKLIIKKLNQGETMSDIARELGISRQRVHQIARRQKWQLKWVYRRTNENGVSFLKIARTAKGMTAEQVASCINVNYRTFINVENGHRKIRLGKARALSELLGQPLGVLFCIEDGQGVTG